LRVWGKGLNNDAVALETFFARNLFPLLPKRGTRDADF
jgi:hypothetical protein